MLFGEKSVKIEYTSPWTRGFKSHGGRAGRNLLPCGSLMATQCPQYQYEMCVSVVVFMLKKLWWLSLSWKKCISKYCTRNV